MELPGAAPAATRRSAWAIGGLTLVVVIAVGVLLMQPRTSRSAVNTTNLVSTVTRPLTCTGWLSCTNAPPRYSFAYPSNWIVTAVGDHLELRQRGTTYNLEGGDSYGMGIFATANPAQQTAAQLAAERQTVIARATPGAKVEVTTRLVPTLTFNP